MTYTAPEGSREQALLRNLAAGLPLPRARYAAGYRDAAALARACDETPGLEEACGEAEREGARARGDGGRTGAEATALRPHVSERPASVGGTDAGLSGVVAPPGCDPVQAGHAPALPPASENATRGSVLAEPTTLTPAVNESLRDLARRLERERVAEEAGRAVANDVAPTRSKRASEATDDGAPDWERIREEAAELAPGVMGWILYQENRLAAADAGFPALSPFSLHTLDGFFLSGKRWLLLLAGRGFGKSTLTGRTGTAIGFGVERKAAPGPAWVCPIVSVLPVDADRRLEDIAAILLHAYLQEVKPAKSMISARDTGTNALAWVSSASTIGNVSGPSSFAALVDEEEKILYGRAGAIVGSLAFTFRSRPRVYGMRVSSAMTADDTLARACAKGNGPGSPLTNFVATLGPFVDDAVAGVLAVAAWEEARGNIIGAAALRAHALTLTPESWQIPTWLGHPSIGNPDERLIWTPGDAAVATRIEAEAVDEKMLDGLPPWRYWLRECASVPTTGPEEAAHDDFDGWEIMGEEHRNADVMHEDRGYE